MIPVKWVCFQYEGKRLSLFSGRKWHSTLIVTVFPAPPRQSCTFSPFVALFIPLYAWAHSNTQLPPHYKTPLTAAEPRSCWRVFTLYLWWLLGCDNVFFKLFFKTVYDDGLMHSMIKFHWPTSKSSKDICQSSFSNGCLASSVLITSAVLCLCSGQLLSCFAGSAEPHYEKRFKWDSLRCVRTFQRRDVASSKT